jgi:hypothetical protein
VIALRKNNVEIVYAAGGYDLWTPGGGSMVAHDLSLEQAVEELRRA